MAKDAEKKSKREGKHFLKDFKAELKKVIWPTPKQVVNNTVAVITIVLITAVIVFALDFVFKAVNTYGIDSIRSIVQSESNADEETQAENDAVDGEAETEVGNTTESENPTESSETVEESNTQE